jgi:8-oxo-dGTP pyrophosphatase MutT (NUDIX family)
MASALASALSVLVVSGGAVRAAGGVVHREGASGVEVIVVHRPRYDDLSLPKGKLLRGESHRDAALREVKEETGFDCELEDELPEVAYVDSLGRPKIVRYWMMRAVAEETFHPTPEVDEVRWVPLEEASEMLTYRHDRKLIRHVMART